MAGLESSAIYINADTVQYHLCQFRHSQPFVDCKIYREVDSFLQWDSGKRIAALHVPFPLDPEFQDLLRRLTALCDHVFVFCTELHSSTVDLIQDNDHSCITYYICGDLNRTLTHSKTYHFMDWFETSRYFYRNWLPEILHRLRPYDAKNQIGRAHV